MIHIETERFIIRRFQKKDAKDLHEYLSNEEVIRFEPHKPFTLEQAEEEAIRRSKDENFYAIVLKSGKLIGNVYLAKGEMDTWELGYVFNNKYWKQGYAYESCRQLLQYIFEKQDARRVIALCDPENENSWRLLEHLEFRREGHLLKNIYFFEDEKGNPIWKDTYEYGLLKEEW